VSTITSPPLTGATLSSQHILETRSWKWNGVSITIQFSLQETVFGSLFLGIGWKVIGIEEQVN
jgi:hypothetical protein